jgi:hypothetical protein
LNAVDLLVIVHVPTAQRVVMVPGNELLTVGRPAEETRSIDWGTCERKLTGYSR